MSEVLCDYSDLPISQCAHCTGDTLDLVRESPAAAKLDDSAPVVVAMFDGRCPECHDAIVAGKDHITKSGLSWVHYGCAE